MEKTKRNIPSTTTSNEQILEFNEDVIIIDDDENTAAAKVLEKLCAQPEDEEDSSSEEDEPTRITEKGVVVKRSKDGKSTLVCNGDQSTMTQEMTANIRKKFTNSSKNMLVDFKVKARKVVENPNETCTSAIRSALTLIGLGFFDSSQFGGGRIPPPLHNF